MFHKAEGPRKKDSPVVKIIILVLLAEIWVGVGQVLLKKSTNAVESYSLRSAGAIVRLVSDVIKMPSIWIGFFAMVVGLAFWLVALAEGDLSLVFSIGSIQYILILFAAHFLLGEKIDRMKLCGTLLVIFGIILITIS